MLFRQVILMSTISFFQRANPVISTVCSKDILVCQQKGVHQELITKKRDLNSHCPVDLGFGKLPDFTCVCVYSRILSSLSQNKSRWKKKVRLRAKVNYRTLNFYYNCIRKYNYEAYGKKYGPFRAITACLGVRFTGLPFFNL